MSNSSLICYTQISPNRNSPRRDKIKKITIHHMAGNLSIETCGRVFQPKSRQASANYGIGSDGRIAMYVEEKDRAWTSSSSSNDNQAVTIEVANCGGAPDWPVSEKAYAALLDLVTDICKRNGITRLNFTGDKSGNLTMHKWFAATACPGPYLEARFPDIAKEVNRRLGAGQEKPVKPAPQPLPEGIKKGDVVDFTGSRHFVSAGAKTGPACKPGKAKVTNIAAGRPHPYHLVAVNGGGSTVYGWVDAADISTAAQTKAPFLVRVTADKLNVRKGPGTSYRTTTTIKDHGVYTIVAQEKNWGKLKSGAGWICLDYTSRI